MSHKRPNPVEWKTYRFVTNSKEVHIEAATLRDAKLEFQQQYGFWPEKGVNYVVPPPVETIKEK